MMTRMPPLCSAASAISGLPMTMVATRSGSFMIRAWSTLTVDGVGLRGRSAERGRENDRPGPNADQVACDARTRPTSNSPARYTRNKARRSSGRPTRQELTANW